MDDIFKYAALGGAGGILAMAWKHVSAVLRRISGILVVRIELHEYPAPSIRQAFQAMIWNDFTTQPSSFLTYGQGHWFVRTKGRVTPVAYEANSEHSRLFWRGWRPLLVSGWGEHVTFIRGTFDPDALVMLAQAAWEKRKRQDDGDRFSVTVCQGKGRQQMMMDLGKEDKGGQSPSHGRGDEINETLAASVRPVSVNLDDIGQPREGRKAMDRLALAPHIHIAIEEAHRWVKSGDWYQERQLPWRRGWLLYGPPGTGKSSLSVALAQDMGIPLYRFDIASMSNTEFSKFWRQAVANTPAIILVEDIDSVFTGRTNMMGEMGGGLSFDHILNTISGVESVNGIFLIITTNKLEAIDPALGVPANGAADPETMSTRPGRLDRALELHNPDQAGRAKIATRVLGDKASAEQIDAIVLEGANDSGAQFQERCSMLALKLFWEKQ